MTSVEFVDDAFWPLLVRDARAMGVDPRTIAAVMLSESGLKPSSINWEMRKNPITAQLERVRPLAIGINQISWSNWKKYGLEGDPLAYTRLTASEQWLSVAGPFFAGVTKAHPLAQTSRDLYWLNYKPATYVFDARDDYPIGPDAGNSVLYMPGESTVTPAGLSRFLMKAQTSKEGAPRWAKILAAIAEAEALGGVASMPPLGPIRPAGAPVAMASASAGPVILACLIGFVGLQALKRRRK